MYLLLAALLSMYRGLCACLLVVKSCATTAELIKMLCVMWTCVDQDPYMRWGRPDPPMGRVILGVTLGLRLG